MDRACLRLLDRLSTDDEEEAAMLICKQQYQQMAHTIDADVDYLDNDFLACWLRGACSSVQRSET